MQGVDEIERQKTERDDHPVDLVQVAEEDRNFAGVISAQVRGAAAAVIVTAAKPAARRHQAL